MTRFSLRKCQSVAPSWSGFLGAPRGTSSEVRATDEAEDQELGEARGDELPEQLRTAEGRRESCARPASGCWAMIPAPSG